MFLAAEDWDLYRSLYGLQLCPADKLLRATLCYTVISSIPERIKRTVGTLSVSDTREQRSSTESSCLKPLAFRMKVWWLERGSW